MSKDQETTLLIRGLITQLPAEQQVAVQELATHIRTQIQAAGEPVGTITMALLGAEMQEKVNA